MMGVGTIAREPSNMTATSTPTLTHSSIEGRRELRRWTVMEYHQMIAAGILTERDRVELIDGEIIQMSPQGPAHSSSTHRSDKQLKRQLSEQADVRVQMPISLLTSEPEPDLVVVRVDERDYADQHPQPEDIFLVIEVSSTTLEFDLNVKGPTYAQAGIVEYWVLDLANRSLYVLREPNNTGYQSQTILNETDRISPLAFPNIEITIADLLAPVIQGNSN
jgi:Uma2 family endonuclease